jgi:hypothetical protein
MKKPKIMCIVVAISIVPDVAFAEQKLPVQEVLYPLFMRVSRTYSPVFGRSRGSTNSVYPESSPLRIEVALPSPPFAALTTIVARKLGNDVANKLPCSVEPTQYPMIRTQFAVPSGALVSCGSEELAERYFSAQFGRFVQSNQPIFKTEDRMPAISVGAGQTARLILTNTRVLQPGEADGICDVVVDFVDGNGKSIGEGAIYHLSAEKSLKAKALDHTGLLRASLIIGNAGLERKYCAIRSSWEIIDAKSEMPVLSTINPSCVGNGCFWSSD